MKRIDTYLVKLPPSRGAETSERVLEVRPYSEIRQAAKTFEDLLNQLHESLGGQTISFEIICRNSSIAFCYSCQEQAAVSIQSAIYGSFPGCDIEKIDDPIRQCIRTFKFEQHAEVRLARSDLFPIRDYNEFESDSLGALLSVFSRTAPRDVAVLQLVMRPQTNSLCHIIKHAIHSRIVAWHNLLRIKYWFKPHVRRTLPAFIEEKMGKRLFNVNIRLATFSSDPAHTRQIDDVCQALNILNTLDLNQLRYRKGLSAQGQHSLQKRSILRAYHLSTTELATVYHFPREKEVPNIVQVASRREPPPLELPDHLSDNRISFFGLCNFRQRNTPFGIWEKDRARHLYVIGKSGCGKSKLLELLIRQDLHSGRGLAVIDPHGDLVDSVLEAVPRSRVSDVIILDPADSEFPLCFNPLEKVPDVFKNRVALGFIDIFKKLFRNEWTPRLEHLLRYTTLALLDTPDSNVLSILRMLGDKQYRQSVVRSIQDDVVKSFWVTEFAAWSERYDSEAITPLVNKVGQFVSNSTIRNIVGQSRNLIDMRGAMDSGKVLLLKVSKGLLGEENASLLGSMIITKLYQAAMSRADVTAEHRRPFMLYVDEFHNFATDSFDEILSESRKYGLQLTLANQFTKQLPLALLNTVLGNVGSLISFRVGADDAKRLAQETRPRFCPEDFVNLSVREFIAKLSIGGEVSEAFSGRTLGVSTPSVSYVEECREHTRRNYCRRIDCAKRPSPGSDESLAIDTFSEPLV